MFNNQIKTKSSNNSASHAENLLHSLVIDGKPIMEMRLSDGFCNLTRLCKAGGKRPVYYFENAGTKAFIEELKTDGQYSDLTLFHVKHGGIGRGT